MSSITYDNLNDELPKRIPELRKGYESLLKWWKDEKPGPHVVYGDLLNPELIAALKSEGRDNFIKRVFTFLEELAKHPDKHVQEVVQMTVCEELGGYPKLLSKARSFMGPVTLKLSHEIEKFWGRE